MSFITVGYTDKVNRRNPIKPPGGGVSDIFNSSSDNQIAHVKKQDEFRVPTTVPVNGSPDNMNGQTETKMCENFSVEQNCNQVIKTTVESTSHTEEKRSEVHSTTAEVNMNGKSYDNNKMVEENAVRETPKKSVNNIIPSDEKDSATPQRRNRVPPGGYSSGLW